MDRNMSKLVSEKICKLLDESFEDGGEGRGYEGWDLDDELYRYYDAGFINGIHFVVEELKELGLAVEGDPHTEKICRIKNYFDSISEK